MTQSPATPPSPRVLAVHVGSARPISSSKRRPTGIFKEPVDQIEVRDPGSRKGASGVAGDFIGDARHHGGSDQAVYAVAAEELEHWARELGRVVAPGSFGENVTTSGFDVDDARVGDVWRVGGALLEVAGPRVPCSTFAAAMQVPRWVRRFAERGRSGAYLAVLEPGVIRPGDAVVVEHRESHEVSVPLMLRAWMGDLDAAREALDAGVLSPPRQAELAAQVAKRTR